jgi:hypothetical protein
MGKKPLGSSGPKSALLGRLGFVEMLENGSRIANGGMIPSL